MIKCTVITTSGRKSDIFEETMTPKDILDYFDIDYSAATNSLDSERLNAAKMNMSLRDLGVTRECRLSSIVKIDNAAKINVVGSSAVVVSDVKLEDWKRIAKLAPESLVVYDEDDEPCFKVGVTEGPGSITEYGVSFSASATGAEGKATVTTLLDPDAEDRLALVRETLGAALINLNEVEKEVPSILEEINKMEAEIDANIVLM